MKDEIYREVIKWTPIDNDVGHLDIFDRFEIATSLENKFGIDLYDDDLQKWSAINDIVQSVIDAMNKQKQMNSG